MTKQDKRFCGICAESGHTSAECSRRHREPPPRVIIHIGHTEAAHALPKVVTESRESVTESRVVTKMGRPKKEGALTAAQKQRAYRERRA